MNEVHKNTELGDADELFVSYDVNGERIQRKRSGWLRNETLKPMELRCRGLPERLIAARKERELTQKELVSQLGINRAALAQWETGLTWPSLVKIEELAEVLGVASEWLAFGIGKGLRAVNEPPAEIFIREVNATGDDESLTMTTIRNWSLPVRFVESLTETKDSNIVLYKIANDSLTALKPGSYVFVDTGVREAASGGYYLSMLHGHPIVVHITVGFDDEASVTMQSGQPIKTRLDKIPVFGKLTGIAGKL